MRQEGDEHKPIPVNVRIFDDQKGFVHARLRCSLLLQGDGHRA
jgi:hypothetical protein